MKNTSKTFTYTAQRGSYISTISALLFIMMVEGGVIIFLVARFVPNELIKLALLSALVVLYLFIGSKLLAPLLTKHKLGVADLQLHYGLDFKATVPRNTIIAAQRVRERVALPIVRYEAEKQRIVAAFSEQGQVLLLLDQPYAFRSGLFSRKFADKLLINVDQPDVFLAALDLATTSAMESVLPVKVQVSTDGNLRPTRVAPSAQTVGDKHAQHFLQDTGQRSEQAACHPERSEGSGSMMGAKMLRCAQHDSQDTGQIRSPESLISKCPEAEAGP
jgi:hypothetical protein